MRGKNVDWREQLYASISNGAMMAQLACDGYSVVSSVVFGRSELTDRWMVVYGGSFPVSRKAFYRNIGVVKHVADANHWCIIWGCHTEPFRTVVSLFSNKWIIYDRYGQFRFDDSSKSSPTSRGGASRTCGPCLEPATVAGQASGEQREGPVPNTEYKADQGDPKTIIENVDELVLTPDALQYYVESYQKRRGLADDVRADAGECEFKLGDSLRVTWIP